MKRITTEESTMATGKQAMCKDKKELLGSLDSVIGWVKRHPVLAVLIMSGLGTSLGFAVDAAVRKAKERLGRSTS